MQLKSEMFDTVIGNDSRNSHSENTPIYFNFTAHKSRVGARHAWLGDPEGQIMFLKQSEVDVK